MTYRDVAGRLGIAQWCSGNCGLSASRHRTGAVFLGVVHWSERRMSRRGLRRFLLVVAKRDRLASPDYLNAPRFTFYYIWSDHQYANMLAAMIGVRFPAGFSRTERLRCLAAASAAHVSLSGSYRTIYGWARRGFA